MKQTFEQFMSDVDSELIKMCNMSSEELEDFPYWAYYEYGSSAYEAAYAALEYNCESSGFNIETILRENGACHG